MDVSRKKQIKCRQKFKTNADADLVFQSVLGQSLLLYTTNLSNVQAYARSKALAKGAQRSLEGLWCLPCELRGP